MVKINYYLLTAMHRPQIRKFIRFLIIGFSNTLIGLVIYLFSLELLPKMNGMVSLAQAISYGTGIIWSYYWNRNWVFGSSSNKIVGEASRFLAVQISLLLISSALIGLFVDYYRVELCILAYMGVSKRFTTIKSA